MTTARFRENAREAEKRCEWRQAAMWWRAAIANYPSTGAMADADVARMRQREDAAFGMLSPFDPLRLSRRDGLQFCGITHLSLLSAVGLLVQGSVR